MGPGDTERPDGDGDGDGSVGEDNGVEDADGGVVDGDALLLAGGCTNTTSAKCGCSVPSRTVNTTRYAAAAGSGSGSIRRGSATASGWSLHVIDTFSSFGIGGRYRNALSCVLLVLPPAAASIGCLNSNSSVM